ncbi:MAG: hypothetical protein M1838_000333 [Thelocarpon superellum]|nr:MAG: hypothetical protein M1838_000333 [Thelocarpon superellum]
MVDRPKKPAAIPVSPITPHPQVSFSSDNARVTATLPTGESVEVLLHGATVVSWKSRGRENLFLSEKAHLDGSKAVRGGIPLVFPVFGKPPSTGSISALPQHGFARISRWEFLNKSTSESSTGSDSSGDNSVTLDFGLSPANLSNEAKKAWPHNFALIYSVTLGTNGLETSLCVRNEGGESFEFQLLLHTYLRVQVSKSPTHMRWRWLGTLQISQDISQTSLSGLAGTTYVERAGAATPRQETQTPLSFSAETDRVYQSTTPGTPIIVREAGKERFNIVRDNLEDVVVWNPWIEKSAGMSDFGPRDAWKKMLCVEAGAVSGWQKLDAGDTFEGGQLIKSMLS